MGPSSLFVLALLLVVAVSLFYPVARARHAAAKIAAGATAFVLSVCAGVLVVNDYYGYYTSWGAAAADISGTSNAYAVSHVAAQLRRRVGTATGRLLTVTLAGPHSGISRRGLVYLPAQYFEPAYRTMRFPVLELFHGSPGNPAQWVDEGAAPVMEQELIDSRRMGPAVLVMPDSNGGVAHFEECLNTARQHDDTYVTVDVPADIRARYRVSLDPAQWGTIGLSSGGYCAANLALRHPTSFGSAASIDGYYTPQDGSAADLVGVRNSVADSNDPLLRALRITPGTAPLPAFWIAAGTGVPSDYDAATRMVSALRRLEQVPFVVMKGAYHNMAAVRSVLPSALTWSWQQLASPDQRALFPTITSTGGSTLYTTPPPAAKLAPAAHRHRRTKTVSAAADHNPPRN